jgi:hypothetical protein
MEFPTAGTRHTVSHNTIWGADERRKRENFRRGDGFAVDTGAITPVDQVGLGLVAW